MVIELRAIADLHADQELNCAPAHEHDDEKAEHDGDDGPKLRVRERPKESVDAVVDQPIVQQINKIDSFNCGEFICFDRSINFL